MTHRLSIAVLVLAAVVLGPLDLAARNESALVERFLMFEDAEPLVQYRAIRRMRAVNEQFRKEATLEARTAFDQASGFQYEIVDVRDDLRV